MNEIKKSVRRLYTRLLVLTAVVVFGAIAIAQAQKERDSEPATQAPESLNLTTKPLAITTEVAHADSDVARANVDTPINESEQIRWRDNSQDLAVDELPGDESWNVNADTAGPGPSSNAPFEARHDEVMLPDDEYLPESHYESVDVDVEDSDLTEYDAEQGLDYDTSESYGTGVADVEQFQSDGYDEAVVSADDAHPAAYESSDGLEPTPPIRGDEDAYAAVPETPLPESTLDDNNEILDVPVGDPTDSTKVAPIDPPPLPYADSGDRLEETPALIDDYPNPESETVDSDTTDRLPVSNAATYGQLPQDISSSPAVVQPREPRFAAATQVASTGRPGPRNLEGPQTPTFTVEKKVPAEIQVGKAAKFEIRVRNVGRVAAENVVIRDEVPMGTDFVDSNPKATQDADGAVYWDVGTIPPGDEVVVSMDLMPMEEGQIGSVATVSFEASATARTRATKPELVIEHTGPREVLVGETVRFSIKLSNPGSGAATQVFIEEDVPVGLSHSTGSKLEYEVGTILPGQTRHLELSLKAAQPGKVINTLTARGAGNLIATDQVELNIVAPKLQVAVDGPSRRFLDRQATFSVSIANPGTAPAHDVEIVAKLPKGIKFVSTNNSGYYDQSRHAVIWSLEQLPAGEMGKAQFTAKPTDLGQFQIRADSKARSGLTSQDQHALVVEGIAALNFALADQVDPVEIGGRTIYEITISNQGSKAATNVRLDAIVPEGLKVLSAEGPGRERIEDQQVAFEPIDRLAPRAESKIRIVAQAIAPGDHRFRIQLSSDEMSTPVIKEESTRVYAD